MKKLTIKMENCFGIQLLEHSFDFENVHCALIYAPNGMMKSSFAKTFDCIAKQETPSDKIYPERKTITEILCDEEKISSDNIVVANAESDINSDDKITTLLASKELKSQYDKIYQVLDAAKKAFLTKLIAISKSTDCESEIISTFRKSEKEDFFDCVLCIQDKINETNTFFNFRYNAVFDKKGKVGSFLKKHKGLIQEYFDEYNQLLSSSDFFKKNEDGTSFGTYQARQIINSVNGDSFFHANHKMVLRNLTEITSKAQLEEMVNSEINKILDDDKIKAAFQKIDDAIGKNDELRAFRTVLENDKSIIPNLLDYDGFRKKVWFGFLGKLHSDVLEMLSIYNNNREKLTNLLSKAQKENEIWKDIVSIYKGRFYVPFKVTIENQEDVILKQDTANLVFSYKDNTGDYVKKDRSELINILSRGEKRAFFILQLLFELEARKTSGIETLVILDDIADSFDYKNKYAIIEYISDLNKNDLFRQIILTHNFDFYRILDSRLNLGSNVFMAIRKQSNFISLERGQYRKDFFKNVLVANATDSKKLSV